jgi:spore coat protein U-like protein
MKRERDKITLYAYSTCKATPLMNYALQRKQTLSLTLSTRTKDNEDANKLASKLYEHAIANDYNKHMNNDKQESTTNHAKHENETMDT